MVVPGRTKTTILPRSNNWVWFLLGLFLFLTAGYLSWLSPEFAYGKPLIEKPTRWMVFPLLIAGIGYFLLLFLIPKSNFSSNLLFWILIIGLLSRLVLLHSVSMHEDDYFRYLWDGGLVANGISPYKYSPEEVQEMDPMPPRLKQLKLEATEILDRINHPDLRTIYPPTVQGVFAIAHKVNPWSLISLRLVLFLFDAMTLLLILLWLRHLSLSPLWCALYWWCPLILKEIYNAAHMDVILGVFVLGALLLSALGRKKGAVFVLALAVGTKLWPVLLLPVILRSELKNPKNLLVLSLIFSATCFILFLPVFTSGIDDTSGFTAYGKKWEMNDALYMLFYRAVGLILGPEAQFEQQHFWTRILVGTLLLVGSLWVLRREAQSPEQLLKQSFIIITLLFMLSPTQFPWYYLWVLPFLPMIPSPGMVLLAMLLPLYYLRFYYDGLDQVVFFDNQLVWVEYIPVWILLGWEAMRSRNNKSKN